VVTCVSIITRFPYNLSLCTIRHDLRSFVVVRISGHAPACEDNDHNGQDNAKTKSAQGTNYDQNKNGESDSLYESLPI
jgi:hypothetical protein